MAAKKAFTGLTGLAVADNPHHTLNVLYNKIMRSLAKMPADYGYRKYTEQIVTERHNLVKTVTDVAKLEQSINCGQIEEVIQQAGNELSLARKIVEWKAWEPLENEPPKTQWKWPL